MAFSVLGANFDPGPRTVDLVGRPRPLSTDYDGRGMLSLLAAIKREGVRCAAIIHPSPWIKRTTGSKIMDAVTKWVRVGLGDDDGLGEAPASYVDEILAEAAKRGLARWWDIPGLTAFGPPIPPGWDGASMNEFGWLSFMAWNNPAMYLQMLAQVQRLGDNAVIDNSLLADKMVTNLDSNLGNTAFKQRAWAWLHGLAGDKGYNKPPYGVPGVVPINVGVVWLQMKQAEAAREAERLAALKNLPPAETAKVVEAAKTQALKRYGDDAQEITAKARAEAAKDATARTKAQVKSYEDTIAILKNVKKPLDVALNVGEGVGKIIPEIPNILPWIAVAVAAVAVTVIAVKWRFKAAAPAPQSGGGTAQVTIKHEFKGT